MKIKRFNESNHNNEFVSVEEIEEFFYDWTDEELGKLEIKDILITDDKRVIEETPYIKNPNKTRKGNLIKLTLTKKPDGLIIKNSYSNCFTEFETLEKVIQDIKRFYIHTGEPNINYEIKNSYSGLEIYFVTTGPLLSEKDSSVKEIDNLLSELKDIFKPIFRNTTLKGNWLEIRIPANREDPRGWNIFRNPNYVPVSSKETQIHDWKNKVREMGFDLVIAGGDNQAVFKLKKL